MPKVLRMPGTPGLWCRASAAGTYKTSSTCALAACVMGVSGWFSIRGCIWASRSKDIRRRHIHLAVLLLIAMEYCLWTASCFWTEDSLANPYFWFDFGLTASAALLLFATERAVVE